MTSTIDIATDHVEFNAMWDAGLITTDDHGLPVLLSTPCVDHPPTLIHSTPWFVAVRFYECGCTYSATNGWKVCDHHHIMKGVRV